MRNPESHPSIKCIILLGYIYYKSLGISVSSNFLHGFYIKRGVWKIRGGLRERGTPVYIYVGGVVRPWGGFIMRVYCAIHIYMAVDFRHFLQNPSSCDPHL